MLFTHRRRPAQNPVVFFPVIDDGTTSADVSFSATSKYMIRHLAPSASRQKTAADVSFSVRRSINRNDFAIPLSTHKDRPMYGVLCMSEFQLDRRYLVARGGYSQASDLGLSFNMSHQQWKKKTTPTRSHFVSFFFYTNIPSTLWTNVENFATWRTNTDWVPNDKPYDGDQRRVTAENIGSQHAPRLQRRIPFFFCPSELNQHIIRVWEKHN
ncbi:hypothetical protein BST61_g9820 [Cercospora zeina]